MTQKYKIQFNKEHIKDLLKIPLKAQNQIRKEISELAFNPRPEGCKKLHGPDKCPLYRIRCGDYRIVYTIKDKALLVLIIEVGHRREIYR
jgi:mRNA interferase RelE/StbE